MNSYLTPVLLVTGFLLIYLTAILVNLNAALILFLFSLSPALLIWMVYSVLRASVTVSSTFEERWYEDM